MKISGFTMAKNAAKLYYPLREAVASILPLVDEFVVALGDNDPDDDSLNQLLALQSPKIKIIHTVWDIEKYPRGTENAHQTDIAKNACTGDWLFYLQADEAVHEKDHEAIYKNCKRHLNNPQIEGFLFDYNHFWGDYNHCHRSHCWYRKEIRIVRNDPDIHSWESAQSFRRIPRFDGLNYRQQKGTHKLRVAHAQAEIYHYGYVRPPRLMQKKRTALDTIHKGEEWKRNMEAAKTRETPFDYGPLGGIPLFKGQHPAVMKSWIEKFDWANQLNYGKNYPPNAEIHRHDRLKYKILSWIENNLNGGQTIGGFHNYILD